MNFVQQLEECLRDLAAEARKKHPGVKEASERATLKLRTLQSSYVAAVRAASNSSTGSGSSNNNNNKAKNDHGTSKTALRGGQVQSSSQYPTTTIFQSSEIVHPFLLAANYPNADYKLLEISFRALRLLMEADAIVPSDGIHIVRVYQIQAQVVTAYYTKYYAREIAKAESEAAAIAEAEAQAAYAAEQYKNQQQQHQPQRVRIETKDSDNETKTTTTVNDDDDDDYYDDENDFYAEDTSVTTITNNPHPSSTTTSSSSWFSWGNSSTSSGKSITAAASGASNIGQSGVEQKRSTSTSSSAITTIKNAVSSSSGQAGNQTSAQTYPQMEKLALEILSSLLQLVQLLTNYPNALTEEIWTHSVALTCLWYSLLPTHVSSRVSAAGIQSNTVQQAAHSTIHQLMSVLFQTNTLIQSDDGSTCVVNHKFIQRTWEDLLSLSASERRRTGSGGDMTTTSTVKLTGAFQLCQKRARTTANDTPSSSSTTNRRFTTAASNVPVALQPSPSLALELMTLVWRDSKFILYNSSVDTYYDELLLKSFGVTMELLQKVQHSQTSIEKSLRTIQWTLSLLQSHAQHYPNECRELIVYMIKKQIPIATTACRKNHDFEDGYVYSIDEAQVIQAELEVNNVNATSSSLQGDIGTSSTKSHDTTAKQRSQQLHNLGSCFPLHLLCKAGFVLELAYHLLDKENLSITDDYELALLFTMNEEEMMRIRGHPDRKTTLQVLTEALSDFATVGSSCRDHVIQVVAFCYTRSESNFKTKLFRTIEQMIANGNTALTSPIFSLSHSNHSRNSSTGTMANKNFDQTNHDGPLVLMGGSHKRLINSTSNSVLGESIWISLQILIRIAECLSHNCETIANAPRLLKEIFAPSLAAFQHFMKRFVASDELVRLTLKGYSTLADVNLKLIRARVDGAELSDEGGEGNDVLFVQKRVLLSSLSKLALPSWGRNDPTTQLQDHHVMSLLCLLRIVHTHFDEIGADFEIILRTFEELSVMSISSQHLSEEVYHASFALAAAYSRFAGLSTCLSTSSLLELTKALIETCATSLQDRDVVGDSDTVLPDRGVSMANIPLEERIGQSDKKDSSSIGGKIMSLGVRAIYGNSAGASETTDKVTDDGSKQERSKNVYYQDYLNDFVHRISLSKCTIRINSFGRIPFSLILLCDIAMANLFRREECSEMFANQFAILAASRPIVRPFLMDITTMLLLAQLSQSSEYRPALKGKGRVVFEVPMYSQLLAVENEDISVSHRNPDMATQEAVLRPLCESIKTTSNVGVAQSSLNVLNSVLEGTGESLKGEVWSIIIDAISSLSGGSEKYVERKASDWSTCCLLAFKVLKLIVDDFMDHIPRTTVASSPTAHAALLDCCSTFVSSRHDINTSLTAIGLLWTIADQDSDLSPIDRALSKLVELSCDERTEVRNAAVNTLFSCIVGRGANFSPSFWKICISETIFKVYDNVTDKLRAGTVPAIPTKLGKATHSRYKVTMHHSRDSEGKQWIVTQVLVLRGLTRVLRSFFSMLLDSVLSEGRSSDGAPRHHSESELWLQDSWVRILDYAFEAAGQRGGRENIDIRFEGVELLVVCCQLASTSGIQAAMSPAKVSTKMEVINGALRHVRDAATSRVVIERSYSESGEALRDKLFLEAFESLECFNDEILKKAPKPDDIDLQVLHKFCSNLSRLYDCCRETEFKTDRVVQCIEMLRRNADDEDYYRIDLEGRYMQLVISVLTISSTDHKARFLNQSQRCAIDTLQAMAADGSPHAFHQLTSFAGVAFFVRREGDGSEAVDETDLADIPCLLNFEAATVVCSEISKESVISECKILTLHRIQRSFLDAFHSNQSGHTLKSGLRRRQYYKMFVPIFETALPCTLQQGIGEVNMIWEQCEMIIRDMLTPLPLGRERSKIPRAHELKSIISVAVQYVPTTYLRSLASTLAYGATKAFDVAKQHAVQSQHDPMSEMGRKSKKHRDDLVELFETCYTGTCSLNPDDIDFCSCTKTVLTDALTAEDDAIFAVCIEASAIACRALAQRERIECVITAIFPIICSIVVSDNKKIVLKDLIQKFIVDARVGDTLERSQARYQIAEIQVEDALERIRILELQILKLTSSIIDETEQEPFSD